MYELISEALDYYHAIAQAHGIQGKRMPESFFDLALQAFNSTKLPDLRETHHRLREEAYGLARSLSPSRIRESAAQLGGFLMGVRIMPLAEDAYRPDGRVNPGQFEDPVIQAKSIRYSELLPLLARTTQATATPKNMVQLLRLCREIRLLLSIHYQKTLEAYGKQREFLSANPLGIAAEAIVPVLNSNGFFISLDGKAQIWLTSLDGKLVVPIGTEDRSLPCIKIPIDCLLRAYYVAPPKRGTLTSQLDRMAHRLVERSRIIRNTAVCEIKDAVGMHLTEIIIRSHRHFDSVSWLMQSRGRRIELVETPRGSLMVK